MDILFEVGRTPTPPKPPVNASPRPSVERQDAARSQDRSDAYDRRKPPEERETRGRDERPERPQDTEQADRRRADASGQSDRKGAAEGAEARQPDNKADAGDAEKAEDSFSSHMAAKQNEAKKPSADAQSKITDLVKPTAAPVDSIADKIVVKPVVIEAEAAAASSAYPAADHTKAVLVANAAEAKPLEAAPAIIKAEPPKTGDVKAKSALVTTAPVAARAATATAADGSRAAGFALPQDLQGGAVPVDGSPLDIDAEIKSQLGERVDVRPAGAAPQKTALPTFNRLLSGEMTPPLIPRGEVMIDAGLGGDASPDLAALKQITATGHASPVSAVGAASQAAQAPAVSQLVAAVKAERVGNGNTIEVRLDPPDLGRVRIDFSLETADAVKAVVTVERSETLEHLRRNVNDLMDQLKQAGFTSVDLEFSDQGSSAFEEGEAAAFADMEGDAPAPQNDVVYLSLRDDAQMNLLV